MTVARAIGWNNPVPGMSLRRRSMGISSDAYLYYGVDVYDEEEGEDAIKCPQEISAEDWENDRLSALEKWLKSRFPAVSVDIHCCSRYPITFLHVACHRAYRGYPEQLTGAMLDMPVLGDAVLREALECLGAESAKIEEIGWRLASYTDGV
jgi:hypothetical protein